MASIYDRLGDLLNETLEAGEIKFVKVPVQEHEKIMAENTDGKAAEKKSSVDMENSSEKESVAAETKFEKESSPFEGENLHERFSKKSPEPEYHRPEATGTIYHGNGGGFSESRYTPRQFVYKKVTPEIERAFRILDLAIQSTAEEAKKAFKEKVKYYHPDRYADNPVLQKVATDKTRQVVESYKLISDFLGS